jgi:hypothetical protein
VRQVGPWHEPWNSRFVTLQRVGSRRRADVHNIRLENQPLAILIDAAI